MTIILKRRGHNPREPVQSLIRVTKKHHSTVISANMRHVRHLLICFDVLKLVTNQGETVAQSFSFCGSARMRRKPETIQLSVNNQQFSQLRQISDVAAAKGRPCLRLAVDPVRHDGNGFLIDMGRIPLLDNRKIRLAFLIALARFPALLAQEISGRG